MNPDEPVETIEQPDEPLADIIQFPGAHPPEDGDVVEGEVIDSRPDAPNSHSILEVWRAVLEPARTEASKKVTPQWASRMVASYSGIGYADMVVFRDRYYAKHEEMLQILLDEIALDDQALTYVEPAEDAEHNGPHYKSLLFDWQKQFLRWELEWNCTDPYAAVELACISEIHKMFFSDKGICAFLDQIRFEFTEADQAELTAELEAMKEEQ